MHATQETKSIKSPKYAKAGGHQQYKYEHFDLSIVASFYHIADAPKNKIKSLSIECKIYIHQ